MHILLVGPYFGNKGHGAEEGIADSIQLLGHELSIYDPRTRTLRINEKNIEKIDFVVAGSPDLVLVAGAGGPPKIFETNAWRRCKCPKVNWNSEPVRLDNYRDKIVSQKDEFDFFFTFDESEVPIYNEMGIANTAFLPQAFNPQWYKTRECDRNCDWVFVGSIGGKWSNRVPFIQRASRHAKDTRGKFNYTTCFNAISVCDIYQRSKAVLNLGLFHGGNPHEFVSYGLQQRVFESIGAGRIPITNAIPSDTNQIFEDGKTILFYDAKNFEKVLDVVRDDKVRQEMEASILAIREEHTYSARIKKMLNVLKAKGLV